MPDEKMTLIEKLLNPAWRASKDSEWADLDVEQTVATMREAAALITSLQETLAAVDHTLSVHGHIDDAADAALAYALWDSENTVRMPAPCIQEHIARAQSVRHWLRLHGHDVRSAHTPSSPQTPEGAT